MSRKETTGGSGLPARVDNSTPPEQQKRPASLIWLDSVNPTIFTPITWADEGMSDIRFNDPSGETLVNIARTIRRYTGLDGKPGTVLQDEVQIGINRWRSQFNYRINEEGEIIEFNDEPEFTGLKQESVDLILKLVKQNGTRVVARHKDFGPSGFVRESEFESDGVTLIDIFGPRRPRGQTSTNRLTIPSLHLIK